MIRNFVCHCEAKFVTMKVAIYIPKWAASREFGTIAYASSEGSGEPAHPRSLARTSAARSHKQWVKRNLQTESQIPGPSQWLGMHSWNLSWRNAWRHKFAWRGPYDDSQYSYCLSYVLILLVIFQIGLFSTKRKLCHYVKSKSHPVLGNVI